MLQLAKAVVKPTDYYRGLRRRSKSMPDNILMFVRKQAEQVSPKRGGDAFHERWVLLVILAGTGELRLDRQPLRLKPGTAVLLPPLHLHGYVKVSADINWLFVTFEWPSHTALGAICGKPACARPRSGCARKD